MERRARLSGLPVALALALSLALSLAPAGCAAASSSAKRSTPPPTAATATGAPVATSAPSGSATPTITPLPGSANLAGAADICATSISVSTTLPAEIPAFNEGQLRLAQTNGGISEFGYCSGASVASIEAFFTAQLPGKGWEHIQTFNNNATRNIIATRGAENLTITILPDAEQSSHTDLLVILTGQG